MIPLFFLILLGSSLLEGDAFAAGTKVTTNFYDISGRSAQELRQEINAKGFAGPNGRRFDARTVWFVKWTYSLVGTGNSCILDTISATADITYIFPRWVDFAASYPNLQRHWNDYLMALKFHEEGHGKIAWESAIAVEEMLKKFMPAKTCEKLSNDANAAANAILADYREREKAYDASTGHGRTQGAVFP